MSDEDEFIYLCRACGKEWIEDTPDSAACPVCGSKQINMCLTHPAQPAAQRPGPADQRRA